jgi:hypothetical protein
VHDEEEAEERDGAGEVEVFEREADARREQLRQHPGQARVHPQERLLRIHPPCRGPAPAPAVPQTLTRPGLSSFPSLMEASIRLGLNYSGGGGEWIEKGIRSAVGEICPCRDVRSCQRFAFPSSVSVVYRLRPALHWGSFLESGLQAARRIFAAGTLVRLHGLLPPDEDATGNMFL